MDDWIKAFIALKDFVEDRIYFGTYILNSVVALALLFSLLWLATHVYELLVPIVVSGIDFAKGFVKLDVFITQLITLALTTIIFVSLVLSAARLVRILVMHNFMFDNIRKRLEKLEKISES